MTMTMTKAFIHTGDNRKISSLCNDQLQCQIIRGCYLFLSWPAMLAVQASSRINNVLKASFAKNHVSKVNLVSHTMALHLFHKMDLLLPHYLKYCWNEMEYLSNMVAFDIVYVSWIQWIISLGSQPYVHHEQPYLINQMSHSCIQDCIICSKFARPSLNCGPAVAW